MERRGSAGNRRRLNDFLDRIDARIEERNRPAESAPPGRAVDANRKIGRMVARLRASDDQAEITTMSSPQSVTLRVPRQPSTAGTTRTRALTPVPVGFKFARTDDEVRREMA